MQKEILSCFPITVQCLWFECVRVFISAYTPVNCQTNEILQVEIKEKSAMRLMVLYLGNINLK